MSLHTNPSRVEITTGHIRDRRFGETGRPGAQLARAAPSRDLDTDAQLL